MPKAIPNTTLLDPTAAGGWLQFAGADLLAGGFFVVANNPAEVQMAVRQDGSLPQWGASIYCPPGVYPLVAGSRQPVAGLRARNFIVGSPVQLFGALFYPGEAQVLAGTPFDSVVAAGGGISPVAGVGEELAYAEFTAQLAVSATTEATANTIVTAPAVTFDGATVVLIEFWCPYIQLAAILGANCTLVLYQDGVSIGLGPNLVNPAAQPMAVEGSFSRRMTPALGARTYSIRGMRNTGNAFPTAGLGGLGNNLPGFIRITRAV